MARHALGGHLLNTANINVRMRMQACGAVTADS